MPPQAPMLVPASPPPPIRLTAKQAALFAIKDEYNHDAYKIVNAGHTLLQYNYNPAGEGVAKIIVHDPKRTRTMPADESHHIRALIPSPSGSRMIIMSEKTGDYPTVDGGHAVEVDLADLSTEVAITGTTGRSGGFLASTGNADLPTLHGVDYVGDDDTLIASMGARTTHLILLRREPASRKFVEVSRLKVLSTETQLAASGNLIVTSGAKKLGLYGIEGNQIVKRGQLDKPASGGSVFAHPSDTREQLWLHAGEKAMRFVNLDGLRGAATTTPAVTAKAPAAKKPAAKTPAAKKPAAKKPAAKTPAAKKPAAKKPAAKKRR